MKQVGYSVFHRNIFFINVKQLQAPGHLMFFCAFFMVQQALENKLRNKKMAAARAGWRYVYVCSFNPYKQYALPFYFSPNEAFDADWHYDPKQIIPHSCCRTLQPFSSIISRGLSCFPVGERKDNQRNQECKLSSCDRKVILQINGRLKKYPHSHIQIADTNADSPAHFNHFYT